MSMTGLERPIGATAFDRVVAQLSCCRKQDVISLPTTSPTGTDSPRVGQGDWYLSEVAGELLTRDRPYIVAIGHGCDKPQAGTAGALIMA
jgi:hypothetical protein